jgi:hypothetical protein
VAYYCVEHPLTVGYLEENVKGHDEARHKRVRQS